MQRRALEVDGAPAQVEQLAETQPAEGGHHKHQRVLTLNLGRGTNERMDLGGPQELGGHQRSAGAQPTGPVHKLGGVPR